MFEKIAETLLGDWGKAALSFVYEHQLIISTVVLAWGITMIIIRRRKKNTTEDKNNREK